MLHRVVQAPKSAPAKGPSQRLDLKPPPPALKPYEKAGRDLAPLVLQTEEAMRVILRKKSAVHLPDKMVLLRAFGQVRCKQHNTR